MERHKVFDKALFAKKIGGNGIIVITDTIYLISGVFFGFMKAQSLFNYIIFVNMFITCILYHNFVVSRGDINFELNTEKIIYFPTTRLHFLMNKYAKTLILLIIQLIITLACLGLGFVGKHGDFAIGKQIASLLLVVISILLTSGMIVNVMHVMSLGIYLAMLLYIPLMLFTPVIERIFCRQNVFDGKLIFIIFSILFITVALWLFFLWLGKIVYEKIN